MECLEFMLTRRTL